MFKLNSITIRYTDGENRHERTYTTKDTAIPSLIRHAMLTVSWWLQYVVTKEQKGV